MDYVVAGLGIGAILALIGFALWELFGDVEEPGVSWLSRVAIGLMIGALVIWSVTIVSLISHTDDSRGSLLVLMTSLVTLVAIGAGAFWYWRADRALAATRPRAEKRPVQRDVAAMESVSDRSASDDVELTEWDSWPERSENEVVVADAAAEVVAPAVSFEPEVAAEAAVVDVVGAEPSVAAVEAKTGDDTGSEVVQDTVIAETVAPVDVPEIREPVEAPKPELPPNVRLLPVRQVPRPGVAEFEPAAEALEVEALPEPTEELEREPEPDLVENEAVAPDVEAIDVEAIEEDVVDRQAVADFVDPEEPLPFESTVLADVDGSLAGDDGGYRSPLLSDLGSDQLEGVGLARWRPDARLTADDEEHTPPAKTGRR